MNSKHYILINEKENAWYELYSTISRPLPRPKIGKIAVQVINHYGDEVMKIIKIK